MKKSTKSIKSHPYVLITGLVALISIIFFIYIPSQVNIFQDHTIKKVYYVDNISEAHRKIINKFNQEYKDEIEVIPVDLSFYTFPDLSTLRAPRL